MKVGEFREMAEKWIRNSIIITPFEEMLGCGNAV